MSPQNDKFFSCFFDGSTYTCFFWGALLMCFTRRIWTRLHFLLIILVFIDRPPQLISHIGRYVYSRI